MPVLRLRHKERLIVIYITPDKDVISVRILKIEYGVMAVNQQFTRGLSHIATYYFETDRTMFTVH